MRLTVRLGACAPLLGAALACVPGAVCAQGDARDPPAPRWDEPIVSMGQPPLWKPYAGVFALWNRPQPPSSEWGGAALAGVYRDLLSPIVGVGGALEGYAGYSDREEWGVRALGSVRGLFLQLGVDYDLRRGDPDLIVTLAPPLRRGGLFGRGGELRIDLVQGRRSAWNFGVTVPLAQPWMGKTRPRETTVALPRPPRDVAAPARVPDSSVADALRDVAESARWITLYTYAFLDNEERGGERNALREFDDAVRRWRDSTARVDARHPQGHTYATEVALYHGALERAFAASAGAADGAVGRPAADAARAALLDEVLLPYDRLLGRFKRDDSLDGLGARARARFAEWLRDSSNVPAAAWPRMEAVMAALVAVAETQRRSLASRWADDSRFVWLPLQLALRPDEHDSQAKLDGIIARAVGRPFTGSNEFRVANSVWFQLYLRESLRRAEDYHVLWIHDFRGYSRPGRPDSVGYFQLVQGYLAALTARVRDYDRAGRLPVFIVLNDQIFYEVNGGRLWLSVLEDPLGADARLPAGAAAMAASVRRAQQELRDAVAASRRLQADAAARGGAAWLRRVVKVHVNVTNPVDWSFRARRLLPWFPWTPDIVMRDHRKIVLFDVTEADPRRGAAIYTGTGVGEHYATATWEDRAIVARGPAVLAVKDAARGVLLGNGFRPDQIPWPLRPLPRPAAYDSLAALGVDSAAAARALDVQNATGFGQKDASVVQAILYTLMPPGSVIYVPDSIWLSSLWAGQLVGAAYRGCHVYVIAPALANAPAAGGLTLARGREVLSRMLEIQNLLQPDLQRVGGSFRVGLYTRQAPVGDLAAQLREAAAGHRAHPFLREEYPFPDELYAALDAAPDSLVRAGFQLRRFVNDAMVRQPQLHRKTQFFATREALRAIAEEPGLRGAIRDAILAAALAAARPDAGPALGEAHARAQGSGRALLARLPPDVRRRAVYYLTTGSMNKDPRGMALDGEAMFVVAGEPALAGYFDFFLLAGETTWLTDQAQLDRLLPPYGRRTRRLARMVRDLL